MGQGYGRGSTTNRGEDPASPRRFTDTGVSFRTPVTLPWNRDLNRSVGTTYGVSGTDGTVLGSGGTPEWELALDPCQQVGAPSVRSHPVSFGVEWRRFVRGVRVRGPAHPRKRKLGGSGVSHRGGGRGSCLPTFPGLSVSTPTVHSADPDPVRRGKIFQ